MSVQAILLRTAVFGDVLFANDRKSAAVQTASNLIAYETGYFRGADVSRLGLAMLGLTIPGSGLL